MKRNPLAWMLPLGLLVAAMQSAAQEALPELRPAMIGSHETSLAGMIEFPRGKGDVRVGVRCQARIDGDGTILTNACFNGEPEYQKAILAASKKSTLAPAIRNREATPVYVLYTVLFIRQGEAQDVVLIPNHGVNSADHGISYIAPQRIVTGIEGESACSDMTYFNSVAGTVGMDGALREMTIGIQDDRCPACVACIEEFATSAQYIPGYTKEGPEAMKVEEPWFRLRGKPDWYWRRSRKEPIGNAPEEGAGAMPPPGFAG